MYHAIVKRIARKNFELVNQANFDKLLAGCAPNIHHSFKGHHALGGERHDREALRRWFQRLHRLNPGLRLHVQDAWVKGLPHNTTVILRWTATDTRIDGTPYLNQGAHIIRLRWMKVVDIDVHENSQIVAENLQLLAAHGVEEASASPITS